jgi:Bacterial Ig-like domain (group 3)
VSSWRRQLLRASTVLATVATLACGLVIAPRFDAVAASAAPSSQVHETEVAAKTSAVLTHAVTRTQSSRRSSLSAEAADSTLIWSPPSHIDTISDLASVSCPSASFCMAIDVAGNTFAWNGTSWSAGMTLAYASRFAFVSCASASFCMALGDTSDSAYYMWNGASWASGSMPLQDVSEVSCPSASFCIAVAGVDSLIWNGSSWSSGAVIDNAVTSVSCASASFCMAVDFEGDSVTWNGTSWSSPAADPAGSSDGGIGPWVSCSEASFCMAVGDAGTGTWNGTSWSSAGAGPVGNGYPLSVSCPYASFCVALSGGVGLDAQTWNGTSWSSAVDIDNAFGGPTLASVSCPSASFCMAVDEEGDAIMATAGGGLASSSVSVSDDSQSVSPGGDLTFTATVTGSGPTPTGTVTWTLSGPDSPTCPDSTLSAGTATCTVSDAQAGTYTATAHYGGDSSYNPASGSDNTALVAKVVPTVSVSDNASSIPVGGVLIFTATVTGSGTTPTGTVTWAVTDPVGVSVPCSSTSGPAGSGSVATYTCSIASAVAGTYSATADYPGDSNYGSASGTDDTADVVAATVTLNLSAAKVTYGHEKTEKLSVRVTPPSTTGTVTISYGTAALCSIKLSAGKGSCSLSNAQLTAGTYSLVASYAGKQSAQQLLIVAKATSKITLKLSVTKVTYGEEEVEQLSVTVTGQGKGLVPTGTVTIAESSTTICSFSLTLGKGSCSLSASQLAVGRYSLVATYGATTDFVGSASTKKTLTVVK